MDPLLHNRDAGAAQQRRGKWFVVGSALFVLLAWGQGCSSDPSSFGDEEVYDDFDAAVEEPDAEEADVMPLDAGIDVGPDVQMTDAGGCPVLAFPSGVSIQTIPDATMTAVYQSIADNKNYPLPQCFIDTDNMIDLQTGNKLTVDSNASMNFTFREFVGTSLGYTRKVLLSPTLVMKIQKFRENLGRGVRISSGYRSPQHQRAVCRGICGKDACPGLCAARSRHSWGDAVDIGELPTKTHSDAACAANVNYVYLEGDHTHIDLNPEHKICTVDIL